MSEVIDLVTPPKPSARRAEEITFFDLTHENSSTVSAQGIFIDLNDRRRGDACDADHTPYIPSRFSVTHLSPKRKKSRPLKPRTPPSLGGFADVYVDAILAGAGGRKSKEECCFDDELIADAGLVESKSDVCPPLQLAKSECCPPALNATVPTSSPTANATALGSCQVSPAGITSPVNERIGDGKTCADLLVDKIMNAEEIGDTCAGMFEVDDVVDDNPCYDIVAFNKTRRNLRLCGYDETKATEVTIAIYSRAVRTDIAAIKESFNEEAFCAASTTKEESNITVSTQSMTAVRTVSFDEDASPAPAIAVTASVAYSAAVATATEDSSEDGDSPERTDIANIKESFDEEAFCAASAPSSYTKPKVSQSPRFRFFTLHPI